VLGLPWEYTAADVCALIQASVEAEAPAMEKCVQAVEVAYREDGKSEVSKDTGCGGTGGNDLGHLILARWWQNGGQCYCC
jgi:hypothetical protein